MIREWGTVVSWKNGVTLVNCNVKINCSTCISHKGCDRFIFLLNKYLPQTSHLISVSSKQPLVRGQKVEIGIAKGKLLNLVILIYLLPLAGFFLGTYILQILFINNLIEIFGGTIGAIGSFLLFKNFFSKLARIIAYHTIILNTDIPPDVLYIEKSIS